MAETRLSVTQCRKLIHDGDLLTDAEIVEMRDRLYVLADVIADAYQDLNEIDQNLFNPPGTITQQLHELEVRGHG